jgi:serine/threonine-protein kinase
MELIGTLLCDKWRLRRVLGVGGMSTVYEAVHRNGNRVAIKMLSPEGALSAGVRRRFLREGYVANRVGHPGAVTVSDDVVSPDGKVFLVMELLEGESLGARSRRLQRGLPVREVLMIADQVLDVLACAHERGIVHRDIKPDNVFVTCNGMLKLLDFGIASVRDLRELGVDVTRSGATLGTPAFMAPEQARGAADEVDGRTDLWAVGAMMFTLLTQRHVHEGRNLNEVFVAAATQAARSIADVAADLEPGVADLIDSALRYDRSARWPNARAMQAAVRGLAERHGAWLPDTAAIGGEAFAWPRGAATEPELTADADPPERRTSSHFDWSWTRESRPSVRWPGQRQRLTGVALATLLGVSAMWVWSQPSHPAPAASLRAAAASHKLQADLANLTGAPGGALFIGSKHAEPAPAKLTVTGPLPVPRRQDLRRAPHKQRPIALNAPPLTAATPLHPATAPPEPPQSADATAASPHAEPTHQLHPKDTILDRRD